MRKTLSLDELKIIELINYRFKDFLVLAASASLCNKTEIDFNFM